MMKKKRALKVVPKVVLGSVFVAVVPSLAGCEKSRQDVQSPVAQMMTVAMMMPVDAAAPAPTPTPSATPSSSASSRRPRSGPPDPNGVARGAFGNDDAPVPTK